MPCLHSLSHTNPTLDSLNNLNRPMVQLSGEPEGKKVAGGMAHTLGKTEALAHRVACRLSSHWHSCGQGCYVETAISLSAPGPQFPCYPSYPAIYCTYCPWDPHTPYNPYNLHNPYNPYHPYLPATPSTTTTPCYCDTGGYF